MKTDRERLVEILRNEIMLRSDKDPYEDLADQLISKGVTIPVRCHECKHYNTNNCGDGSGFCEFNDFSEMDDHFCSYGERKEDD